MATAPQETFRVITSQKGGSKIIEGGYMYGMQRKVGDVIHWQCEQRGVCKAIVHTNGMDIVRRTNEHLHAPDEEAVRCYETKIGIKRQARQSQDSSHHIVGESLLTVSECTAAKLPKLDSLKRTIQRQRVQALAAPVQPATRDQLTLPPEYVQTAKGEQFLLNDSGPEVERILIFGTQRNLGMLQLSHVWLADGTFKTAPTLFAQVYVLHALRGGPDPMKDGHLLPSLFVLLPNKTRTTYVRMWHQIQLLCLAVHPIEMIMDFEMAALKSIAQFWPDTMLKCCFFHLTQNIWRKVQAEGMQAEYNLHGELAIRIRLLPALAFAPPSHVRQLFTEVAEQLPMPQAAGLLAYFEDTYIGRLLPGGTYQKALFPIDLWNYHIMTPFGLPRTTNAVEAWHRSFNSTVGCHHPNIWKFITALKREQGLVEERQAKFIAGTEPPKRRRCQANEKSLKTLIGSYYFRPGLEFLYGVAHHFSL